MNQKKHKQREVINAAIQHVADTMPEDLAPFGCTQREWEQTPLVVRNAVWRRYLELSRGMEQYRRKAELFDRLPKMGSILGMPMAKAEDAPAQQ